MEIATIENNGDRTNKIIRAKNLLTIFRNQFRFTNPISKSLSLQCFENIEKIITNC